MVCVLCFCLVQPHVLPVSPVLLHPHHLTCVRHHTSVSPCGAAVRGHGTGWQSHGSDRHHRQPAIGEAVPERLGHLLAGWKDGLLSLASYGLLVTEKSMKDKIKATLEQKLKTPLTTL